MLLCKLMLVLSKALCRYNVVQFDVRNDVFPDFCDHIMLIKSISESHKWFNSILNLFWDTMCLEMFVPDQAGTAVPHVIRLESVMPSQALCVMPPIAPCPTSRSAQDYPNIPSVAGLLPERPHGLIIIPKHPALCSGTDRTKPSL